MTINRTIVGSRGVLGERVSSSPGILLLLAVSSNDLGGRNGGITGFNVPPSSNVEIPEFSCYKYTLLLVFLKYRMCYFVEIYDG